MITFSVRKSNTCKQFYLSRFFQDVSIDFLVNLSFIANKCKHLVVICTSNCTILLEWDEVAHRHREDEGIDPENEIATEIDEDDGHEKEDEGIYSILIYN